MKLFKRFAPFVLVLLTAPAYAKDKIPVQVRLSVGSADVDVPALNSQMRTLGIKEFESIFRSNLDVTYSFARYIDGGFRFSKTYQNNSENNPTVNQEYRARIDQNSLQALVRIPFVRNKFIRLDAFGAVGGVNTNFKLHTATQDGQLTKDKGDSSLITSYGASAGVGYRKVFLFLEAGVERNKVKNLKRVGSISTDSRELDLSGNYIQVGLMFDGVEASKR